MKNDTRLPFSTTTLLGLHRSGADALVLDGMVIQLGDRRGGAGESNVLVNGLPKAVHACVPLAELLGQVLRRHRGAIERWVSRVENKTNLLDGDLPYVSAATTAEVERFLGKHMIPRLQAEKATRLSLGFSRRASGTPKKKGPPADPFDNAIEAFPFGQIWPRYFAFSRAFWYGLVPFTGQPPSGRLHVVWKGRAYIAMAKRKKDLVFQDYDQHLEQAVSGSFQGMQQEPVHKMLYRDNHYRVVLSQRNHYFVCRTIRRYVVQGPDRALYLFPKMEVAVPIISLRAKQVLHELSVRVTHQTRHMFAVQVGEYIPVCMPMPDGYYPKLHRRPLEEAVLQHLESARATLVGGYHEGNVNAILWPDLHDIGGLNLPKISLAEAEKHGLPVYLFYRW